MMINSPRVTTSNPGMVKGTIKHITVLVSIRDFRTLLDRVVPDMLLRRRQSGVKSTVIFGLIRYKGEWRGNERGESRDVPPLVHLRSERLDAPCL